MAEAAVDDDVVDRVFADHLPVSPVEAPAEEDARDRDPVDLADDRVEVAVGGQQGAVGPVDEHAAVGRQVFVREPAAARPWGLTERASPPTRNGPGWRVTGDSPTMNPPRKTTGRTAAIARAAAFRRQPALRPPTPRRSDPGEEGEPDEDELRGSLRGLRAGLREAHAEGDGVEQGDERQRPPERARVRCPPGPPEAERDHDQQRDDRGDAERPRWQWLVSPLPARTASWSRSRRRSGRQAELKAP